MSAPEWQFVVAACCAALFAGSAQPLFAILMSELIGNFGQQYLNPSGFMAQASLMAFLMFVLGVITGGAQFIMFGCFGYSGESVTKRLRSMTFRAMMRQEMSWFDDSNNQVGSLTASLATDASMVKQAAGPQLGIFIQSSTTIVLALLIAFFFGWQLAFVVLAFFPFLVASGTIQAQILQGFSKSDAEQVKQGAKLASEVIDNIRTVAALTREETFQTKFNKHFDKMSKAGVRRANLYGATFSLAQSIIFFCYAGTFTYGAWLVQYAGYEFKNVFRVFSAITFSGQAIGRAASFGPDYQKGKNAAVKIFRILDRVPAIDTTDPSGLKPEKVSGKISFKNVNFTYPTRPDVQVLRGLDLYIEPSQTVALVGASGCGKSTTMQLLERFYDPSRGKILVDNADTKSINIQWMRSQIGIVFQEPMLFDFSIRENIAYGDNSRDVTMEEVIAAARKANIHDFISSLPKGYETPVGAKGTQLSGGQKQRVAIARAILRNPPILLLDEATSALDTESEKVVQDALEKAREGRTCIVIAHRLSTIQNADVIAVIRQGQVVEQGTHRDLMALQGYYYKLQQAQQGINA